MLPVDHRAGVLPASGRVHPRPLWTREGVGRVGLGTSGLFQEGTVFAVAFDGAAPSEALELTAGERQPDAAFALTSLFASERTGDLLVSAATGFDLRTNSEWPEHHGHMAVCIETTRSFPCFRVHRCRPGRCGRSTCSP